jgi:hypothetical protein
VYTLGGIRSSQDTIEKVRITKLPEPHGSRRTFDRALGTGRHTARKSLVYRRGNDILNSKIHGIDFSDLNYTEN